MQKLAIVDIDGTVSDSSHRVKYIDGSLGKKDFHKFMSLMADDPVNKPVADVVTALYKADYIVVYLTGRLTTVE